VGLIETVHGGYVHGRRVHRLCELIAGQLPAGASVLDVGAGDGWLDHIIQQRRPDLRIDGVDVLVRDRTHIPVMPFDGQHLPVGDRSYDVVLFVDVLHHADDPMVVLREARRVMRRALVIKDHTVAGLLATPTLRLMDGVGNRRHGVALPHNYWRADQWRAAFDALDLREAARTTRLGLYPWPASMFFDRDLHFVSRLEPVPA
jgi:SAM-dependent methyltransferase